MWMMIGYLSVKLYYLHIVTEKYAFFISKVFYFHSVKDVRVRELFELEINCWNTFLVGEESFENLQKYGHVIFKELQDIDENGMYFQGIHYEIKVTCTCDWKAATILEGQYG